MTRHDHDQALAELRQALGEYHAARREQINAETRLKLTVREALAVAAVVFAVAVGWQTNKSGNELLSNKMDNNALLMRQEIENARLELRAQIRESDVASLSLAAKVDALAKQVRELDDNG